MEALGDDLKESSYKVIAFPATALPDNYRNMVYSQWKYSLRHGNDFFSQANSESFQKNYNRYIQHILTRESSVVRVAVLSEDRDTALGWSVVEKNILHFIYIKNGQRGQGLSKFLVPHKVDTITHIMNFMLSIRTSPVTGHTQMKIKKDFERFNFDPWA